MAPTLAGLAALVVWWGIVKIFEIPGYLLPAPQSVAARIVKEWPVLVKHGSYTLLSVLTPYVRYEQVMLARGLDPLYQEIALFQGAHRFRDARAGVKWMATENIALKLEGRTLLVDPGLHQQSLTLQAAFGF